VTGDSAHSAKQMCRVNAFGGERGRLGGLDDVGRLSLGGTPLKNTCIGRGGKNIKNGQRMNFDAFLGIKKVVCPQLWE
jgi:hypothetical protein